MSRYLLRSFPRHSGIALLACSLVLLGVAILASASLRVLQDDVGLTYSAIDRLLAQRAAEAALQDAARAISMTSLDSTIVQVQGSHHLGDITGERFAHGGSLQSCCTPEYFIEALSQPSSTDPVQLGASYLHRYRVNARGKGLSAAITVVLQAEFEAQTCVVPELGMEKDEQKNRQNDFQTILQNSTQSSLQNDGKITDQPTTKCTPYVRQLAWRVLLAG